MSATMTGAEEVAWDLTDLYESPDDPVFEQDLEATRERVRAFRERYRGRIGELSAQQLLEALEELDEIEGAHTRPTVFAHLLFATDTADPTRGALLQRAQEWSAGLEKELLFAQLEWAAVPDERAEELFADPALERWSHFLRALRRFRPHLLSEPEETILTEKSVSGQAAWGRLFSELTSALRASLDGEEVSFEQALARMYSPDREVRRIAGEAVTEGLRPGLRTRAYVFNTLLLDKSIDDRLRSYPHWVAARNLSNEISDEAVDALVEAVVSRYDIPQRYYRLKARLLGLGDRIAFYDRMAPVSSDESKMSWDEARDLVLEAYNEFSDEAGGIVSDFFERSWIDAPVRPNKRNGAFCVTRVPGVHPYVLMNFTGDRRSVLTLAHELGHGLHGALAQPLGGLNAETPLTLAETASVFAEALTFDRLVAADDDPARRLDLLIGRLDDGMATVFRQIAMNRFEDAVHTERREQGELAPDRFGEFWIETQSAMLGDAVDLDGYETWWSYVPHYVVAPGYVYAYTFGYLFSLAIFRNWQRQGDALVEPYLDVLRAGGSRTPEDLAQMVGLDLTSNRIWHDGLEALDEVMGQAEKLAATLE